MRIVDKAAYKIGFNNSDRLPLGQLRHTFDNIIERYVPTEHVVGNFVYFNKH